MLTIDTLWYHMPMTTRWVQLGSIRHVQYFDSDAVTAFYPANSELVHGLGILSLGSDILSPLLDLVWLGLALVAAWAIGRRVPGWPRSRWPAPRCCSPRPAWSAPSPAGPTPTSCRSGCY